MVETILQGGPVQRGWIKASSEFMQKEGVSVSQLKRQSEHSQRNIFHSVLGAFDMQSEVYDAKQDIFSGNN
jgi:lipid A ethanolaminephosphotransferase